jgi:hypothetical protein
MVYWVARAVFPDQHLIVPYPIKIARIQQRPPRVERRVNCRKTLMLIRWSI